MMSNEVYLHTQQMKITIRAFILPYCRCRLGHIVEVGVGMWLSDHI